jgi:hypothetical protein
MRLNDVWHAGMSDGKHRSDGVEAIQTVNVDHVEVGRSLPDVVQ